MYGYSRKICTRSVAMPSRLSASAAPVSSCSLNTIWSSVVLFRILRHLVQKARVAGCPCQREIHVCQQTLPILRVAAGQIEKIGDVIGAQNRKGWMQVPQELTCFQHQFPAGALLQGLDKILIVPVKQGQQGEVFRVHPIDPGGG